MVVSFDLAKDEDKMPKITSLDLSVLLNSIKHRTWESWVVTAFWVKLLIPSGWVWQESLHLYFCGVHL